MNYGCQCVIKKANLCKINLRSGLPAFYTAEASVLLFSYLFAIDLDVSFLKSCFQATFYLTVNSHNGIGRGVEPTIDFYNPGVRNIQHCNCMHKVICHILCLCNHIN